MYIEGSTKTNDFRNGALRLLRGYDLQEYNLFYKSTQLLLFEKEYGSMKKRWPKDSGTHNNYGSRQKWTKSVQLT